MSNVIASVAEKINAPLPAILLLLTILAGYPISFIYRRYLEQNLNATVRHLYFLVLGVLLCILNYGSGVIHSATAIVVSYLLICFVREPALLVKINFVFHMTYLLLGYYFTESNEYDIKWTMPHCVLVLRLIGFGFDIADGMKADEDLSNDQKKNCIRGIPNFIDVAAYSYFPSSFIVGPQFPFNRYERFIHKEFAGFKSQTKAGALRFLVGVVYLVLRQIGAGYFPDDYFLSDDYKEKALIVKMFEMGVWGKISLYKYISCWLLAEGSLILLGIAYESKSETTENSDTIHDWSACSNVNLVQFETGSRMFHYVHSFNVNTNNWVATYVYKRLKFLNNRTLSYAGALFFLAVWHGFHSGYYMAFALEYTIITFERQIESVYNKVVKSTKVGDFIEQNIIGKSVVFAVMKFYNVAMMGFCLIPFVHLSYAKWGPIYSNSSYCGFWALGIWATINLIYELLLNPKRRNPLLKSKDE